MTTTPSDLEAVSLSLENDAQDSSLGGFTRWPSFLPLPLVSYSGQTGQAIIASPRSSALIERRLRNVSGIYSISVRWMLNMTQMADFKDFFNLDLDNGAGQFIIPLKYPRRSELTDWVVRFTSGFQATHQDGNWDVGAGLILLRLRSQNARAEVFAAMSAFIVVSGSHFRTVGGRRFFVKPPS